MALALRRNGASAGCAVAFFLGNPTLNPAVLAWALLALGWQWAALRLVVGVALVVSSAALATRFTPARAFPLAEAEAAALPLSHPTTWIVRWVRSFVRLVVVLVPLFAVLVLLLGAARAFFFPAIGADWGNDWLVVVGLAVAGALFPIPTGAEIPIIQTMMAYGLGAGPAGALLLTLAPVSVPSLAMMAHILPLRVVAALAGLTIAAGLLAGAVAIALGF